MKTIALAWRKSSYSGTNGGECVEVAYTSESVLIRDTKYLRNPRTTPRPSLSSRCRPPFGRRSSPRPAPTPRTPLPAPRRSLVTATARSRSPAPPPPCTTPRGSGAPSWRVSVTESSSRSDLPIRSAPSRFGGRRTRAASSTCHASSDPPSRMGRLLGAGNDEAGVGPGVAALRRGTSAPPRGLRLSRLSLEVLPLGRRECCGDGPAAETSLFHKRFRAFVQCEDVDIRCGFC